MNETLMEIKRKEKEGRYPTGVECVSLTKTHYQRLFKIAEKAMELEEAVKVYKEAKDWLSEVKENVDLMENVLGENERYEKALEEIQAIAEESAETPELSEIWDIAEEILRGES